MNTLYDIVWQVYKEQKQGYFLLDRAEYNLCAEFISHTVVADPA